MCQFFKIIRCLNFLTFARAYSLKCFKLFSSLFLEIKAREDKSAHFFEVEEVDPLTEALDRRLNQQAQMFAEDNSRFVEQREKDIQSIVKSISDLNSIFKELATMVTEQVY